MKLDRHWVIAILLGLCVFTESMAFTYLQQNGGVYYYSSSILYFLAGIAICILPLLNVQKAVGITTGEGGWHKFLPHLFLLFLTGLFAYHIIILSALYKNFPVDVKWADMIPVIQLSCKRLLHGIPVYAPTNEIHPGSVNAYLPMMWAPYLPSEIFGYDPRWTTVTALFVSLFIAARPIFKARGKMDLVPMVLASLSLFLVLNYFLFKYNGFWAMTEEGVVTGYYILLGYALLSENLYLIGITIGCCLLSRYTLTPWIPVYFGYLLFTQPRTNFMKAFITFTVFVTVVFVIPWFILDPLYFIHLPGLQAGAINSFWNDHHIIDNAYHNVGLFKFFTLNQVGLMTVIELSTGFILPIAFVLLAKKLQQRYQLNSRYIAFGSLKLCLVCFYNFIPAPYIYLFFPATLISYAVLFDYVSGWQPNASSAV